MKFLFNNLSILNILIIELQIIHNRLLLKGNNFHIRTFQNLTLLNTTIEDKQNLIRTIQDTTRLQISIVFYFFENSIPCLGIENDDLLEPEKSIDMTQSAEHQASQATKLHNTQYSTAQSQTSQSEISS